MAKITLEKKVENYLVGKLKMVELETTSRKYRKFQSPAGGIFWLGKNGALRAGRTISDSYSITESHKLKIDDWHIKTSPGRP
jgi:hypothetical protein